MRTAVRLMPARVTSLGVLLAALLWAQGLGASTLMGDHAAREQGRPPDNPVPAASTSQVPCGVHNPIGRLAKAWRLRSHRSHRAILQLCFGDDPNDNETSDDPNDDDDAWDDLSANHDSEMPLTVGLCETLPYPNALEGAAVHPIIPSSPLFLTRQRLRC